MTDVSPCLLSPALNGTPEMVADAAQAIKPKVLYPYHYGNTDTSMLIDLMKGSKDIQVRIRNMK